ncbi:PQ-loop repeat-containing protein [Bacillus cereus]|nr:PQ-loop repeat-containing protein [Bacillus cereus]
MEKLLLELLPIIATVFLSICYIPQIVKNYKTKDVSSISLWFWVLLNIALTLMFTNAFMIYNKFGTYGYLITETFNLGLAMIVLIQVLVYRKK